MFAEIGCFILILTIYHLLFNREKGKPDDKFLVNVVDLEQSDPYMGKVKVKRKPCKNCVCGNEPSGRGRGPSGCGSCGLGDEFRCDSCPYSGLPPFSADSVPDLDPYGVLKIQEEIKKMDDSLIDDLLGN